MSEAIYWKEKECYGYKRCPMWLKLAYFKAVKYTCQECGQKTDKLNPHRIIRGNKGGLYTVAPLNSKSNNVKIVCEESCHKKFHQKEKGCGK